MKYIVLLRGVNISGRNKVNMSELKEALISKGYFDVITYLNSGNIILQSNLSRDEIIDDFMKILNSKFNVSVPVFIIEAYKLGDVLNNSPEWWGTSNKEIYDNLIFILPSVTASEVCDVLGEPSSDIEKISVYNNTIFWSFELKHYRKANWWVKTASSNIKDEITIRTANTVKKLLEMSR